MTPQLSARLWRVAVALLQDDDEDVRAETEGAVAAFLRGRVAFSGLDQTQALCAALSKLVSFEIYFVDTAEPRTS
jgi:hypothetical protein